MVLIENIPGDTVQLILVLTYKVFSFELLMIHQSKELLFDKADSQQLQMIHL